MFILKVPALDLTLAGRPTRFVQNMFPRIPEEGKKPILRATLCVSQGNCRFDEHCHYVHILTGRPNGTMIQLPDMLAQYEDMFAVPERDGADSKKRQDHRYLRVPVLQPGFVTRAIEDRDRVLDPDFVANQFNLYSNYAIAFSLVACELNRYWVARKPELRDKDKTGVYYEIMHRLTHSPM